MASRSYRIKHVRDILKDAREIAVKLADFVESNWKMFAYLDNPSCAEIRFYKFRKIIDADRIHPACREVLLNLLEAELRKRGFRVVRKYPGRHTKNHGRITVLFVCRENTT